MAEDPFSSATPYAEELEHNIDFLINHQDIRQCHFPGDQNRAEDRSEEEAYSPPQHLTEDRYIATRNANMYFNRLD